MYWLPYSSYTSYHPSQTPCLPLKNDARFMQDGPKATWSIPWVSVACFPILKQNFMAYRSSKVSDCIFEIHQLWQSGFSRVYSNSCCSCSFELEIIKIGLSSHKIYGNKVLNFQESATILNAYTKNLLNALCIYKKMLRINLTTSDSLYEKKNSLLSWKKWQATNISSIVTDSLSNILNWFAYGFNCK